MKPQTAAGIARGWSWLYTLGLARDKRDRRRAELESDLWESLADPRDTQQILSRIVRGAIDDIVWSVTQMDRSARGSLWWTVGSLSVLSTVVIWFAYPTDGRFMRESMWAWPAGLIFHNLGFVALVGLRAAIDLRLISNVFGSIPVSRLVRKLMPATIGAVVVVVISGLALFAPDPLRTLSNGMNQTKMVLLLIALANAWYLHAVTFRDIELWDDAESVPLAARVSGFVSIAAWTGIIVTAMLAPFWP